MSYSKVTLPLGAVMVDIAGKTLTEHERQRLLHPHTGGVILFSRNFESVEQITELCAQIHALRNPHLLIAVDHEGGRVQRFRQGFTRLPAMAEFGKLWNTHPEQAKRLAEQTGWVLAAELRACGVDFSFTPVLDVDHRQCAVIGNRAFHQTAQGITELAGALIQGLHRAGMASCGKHFPGHGFVEGDSHHVIPVDDRPFSQIMRDDIAPYKPLRDTLTSVMPAHVIYPQCDPAPAGFSPYWLQTVLREQLGYDGVIFSDDLWMEGASFAGDTITERALAALHAGCDMVLICNQPDKADELLRNLDWTPSPQSLVRFARMHGKPHPASWAQLRETYAYHHALQAISQIGIENPELAFGGPDVGEKPAKA